MSKFCPGFILHIPVPRTISLPGFATTFRVTLKSLGYVNPFFCSEDQPAQRISQEGGAVCLEEGLLLRDAFVLYFPTGVVLKDVFSQELVRESHS